jgi:regulator of cell morphogenesis and NO signaling
MNSTPLDALAQQEWKALDALTRHIVDRHHRYVKETVPVVNGWLDDVVDRDGGRHPEVARMREAFLTLGEELLSHMAKEENILFPFIDELAAADRAGSRLPVGPFGTVLHPVRVMEADHREALDLMLRLRELSSGFAIPGDASETYRLCCAELERFEADLQRHIELENTVLFPAALELEQRLS